VADENPSGAEPPTAPNGFLKGLRDHRAYRVALGYAICAWLILQVAAIVLPGFSAPPWVLRVLMVGLALGFGVALVAGWAYDRRMAGRALWPHGPPGRLGWVLTALLPAALVTAFFLLRPLSSRRARRVPADKSVAVLPFENLSSDQDNAFFTDGVQDEILTGLARVADLKVISRTSVMPYKMGITRNLPAIAAQLGVSHVLEGSVERAGGRVRVRVQLIDARSDTQLWAERYDGTLDDVFAIQSTIAEEIVSQLQARLSPQEKSAILAPPTTNMAAYELYLRARSIFVASSTGQGHDSEMLPQAVRILNEAVARDPKFLLAWCLLARVHGQLYWNGIDHTPARLEQARTAVETALRLQPAAGESHLALANFYYHGFRDYDRARAELDIARRTLPNNPEVAEITGFIDRREGRWAQAASNLERALALDPRNYFTVQQTALVYGMLHRFDDQGRLLERALAIVPGDPGTRVAYATLAIDARADVKPYQETLAALVAEDPSVAPDLDDPFYSLCERTPASAARVLASYPQEGAATYGMLYPHAYWEGVVARWEGQETHATASFERARSDVAKVVADQPNLAIARSLLGMLDAGLGRKEAAIQEGRRACELIPVGKDAVDGPFLATNLAQILAWTGEKAAAIDQIAEVERLPNALTYGLLKLHPVWDPLRGDPRFEALVASLAPKPGR
jgi:TolB-like protein/predicted Zn-dependent protease